MKITIYTICYNEELMLPYFIRHYRKRFKDCNIVVYDNQSTDNTKQIALDADCTVIGYDTDGKLDDRTYLFIKNNCWKDAPTDWVMVVDCDELCMIHESYMHKEIKNGTTVIRFTGFNMVNLVDDIEVEGINYGVRAESYDKCAMFNKKFIQEINYGPGAHDASPVGKVKKEYSVYMLCHYKYINPDYMVRRHAEFAKRLSANNIKHGYGGHYQYTEEKIREEFKNARREAIKVI